MQSLDLSPSEFWARYHAWAIGFLLICLNSYGRFNIPPTSRSSTTWGRYHFALVMYLATTLIGWIVLANTPQLLEYLSAQTHVDPAVQQFTAPLYAALVLTVLVSSVRPFRRVDEKVRTFFQDLASIPWEAQRLSSALREKTWLPSPVLQARVRTILHDADFHPTDISFAGDRSPQALWTKISALNDHVSKWQGDERRRFAAFHFQHRPEFQKISTDYNALGTMARRVFRLLDTLKSITHEPKLADVQAELVEQFVSAAKSLEKSICDLISHALLRSTLTDRRRRDEFESMGFIVNVAPKSLFDRMLLLYIMIWLWYVLTLSLAHRPWAALTGTIIATIYIGSALSALRVKRWTWARPSGVGRPIRGYVISGVIALVFALVASFGLGVLRTWDIATTVNLLVERWWPWSLMAAFTAIATAYDMDNLAKDTPRLRWREAALQAAVGASAAAFVYVQLNRLCEGVSDPACAPSPVRLVLSAAFSTGVIGWFVPTWYREPETMMLDYKGRRLQVTARALPNGRVGPTIAISSPQQQRRSSTWQPLPFDAEFASVEEAIAQAVGEARRQIDAEDV